MSEKFKKAVVKISINASSLQIPFEVPSHCYLLMTEEVLLW